MNKLIFPLSLSAALGVAGHAQAAPPAKVEIAYELKKGDSAVAEVRDRLEHDGKTYRLTQSWKGKGIYSVRGEAKRSSRGSIGADGLRPEEFEEERPGRDARKGKPEPQAQDRLSVLWHFAFNPPTRPVTVKVYDGKGVSTQVYEPSGRERVKTPAGEFDAIRITRKDDDRRSQIWLTADAAHLPVRMLVAEKDGSTLEIVAVRISR